MDDLKDKVVIITDCDNAVGVALVQTFVRYGSKVVLCGRDVPFINSVAISCQSTTTFDDNVHILVVECDLTSDTGPQSLIQTALNRFGQIHILVQCNSSQPRYNTQTVPSDCVSDAWNSQVVTPCRLLKATLPHLKKSKGSIVMLSSWQGKKAVRTDILSSLVSVGRDYVVRLLAHEIDEDSVRVNTVNVFCDVPNLTWSDRIYAYFFTTPLGRAATPTEVANYTALVATQADHVTGNNFYLDGSVSLTAPVAYNTALTQLAKMSYGAKTSWRALLALLRLG